MKHFAFVHSRSGLTRPILAGEFNASTAGDAFTKAMSSPAVKKIVGKQQTNDLYVLIHTAKDYATASEMALSVHTPWIKNPGIERRPT
ncbi:hypothetical protein ACLQ9R_01275 [Bordetella hinzii]|uniref:hypothetical protein n=1 Tax=Bordetella hinzii TaxID=103855 RepID=UPI0039FD1E7B